MPILVSVQTSAELSQGDLLQEIRFPYLNGDKPASHDNSYALIVTRDCGAEHGSIVVARTVVNATALPKRDDKKPAQKHYDDLRKMFEHLRDGAGTPDRFYLGTLPGEGQHQRLVAHLDQFGTIKLPDERAPWVARHRVATLADSFKRSLPVRLFGCYAQVGHDDVEWLSTADLEALVSAGREYKAELAGNASRASYSLGQSQSFKTDPKAHSGPQKSVTEAESAVERFSAELLPYERSLAARKQDSVDKPPAELREPKAPTDAPRSLSSAPEAEPVQGS